MKKILICLFLALSMLLAAAFAETASQPAEILTAEPWATTSGARLTLNPDGTGVLASNAGTEFVLDWVVEGNAMTFSYELYGTRSFTFTLGKDGDANCLFGSDGSAGYYQESKLAEIQAAANSGASFYPIPMGETIDLGFVKLTFDSVETVRKVGGDMGWYESQTGNNMLALVGTMENTGNVEYATNNIISEFLVNGEYTYNAMARAVGNEKLLNSLPPLSSCRYYLFLELPDALEGNVSACSVRFALNDQFKTRPAFAGKGEFAFEIAMDEAALAEAMSGPVREMVYFEDCPILPSPESYVDLRQTTSSKSSSNNKVTSIRFGYSTYIGDDDILELSEAYIAALAADGFTTKSTGVNAYEIYDGSKHLATTSIDMDNLRMSIVPGNEGLTSRAAGAVAPAAEEAKAADYVIGDTAELGQLSIALESTGTTKKIYSSITENSGWYHYYEDEGGNPYFYIFGTIKNNGTVPVDIDNIYTQFEFEGGYKFAGDIAGVGKGNSNFLHDLAPLTSTNFYVYTPLPKDLSNFKTCVVTLGADEKFGIKFSSEGGLYNFEHCDYVITIDAASKASASNVDMMKVYTDKATVKAVQAELNAAGFPCGTPDGAAGKKTKAALTDYQSARGLTVTGTITHETLISMGLAD